MNNPPMTEDDKRRFSTQQDFLKSYMQPGKWYTLPELCQAYRDATGKTVLETSISAQLRALRRMENGSLTVNRRLYRPGLFEYQLAAPTKRKIFG